MAPNDSDLTFLALPKNLWVKRTGLMGAVRPQTPPRSPRQAFGGDFVGGLG